MIDRASWTVEKGGTDAVALQLEWAGSMDSRGELAEIGHSGTRCLTSGTFCEGRVDCSGSISSTPAQCIHCVRTLQNKDDELLCHTGRVVKQSNA